MEPVPRARLVFAHFRFLLFPQREITARRAFLAFRRPLLASVPSGFLLGNPELPLAG
jgi:hypothetical protein